MICARRMINITLKKKKVFWIITRMTKLQTQMLRWCNSYALSKLTCHLYKNLILKSRTYNYNHQLSRKHVNMSPLVNY